MKSLCLLFLSYLVVACGVYGQSAPPLAKDTLAKQITLKLPEFLETQREIPKSAPLKQEVVELGRRIFFDPVLSKDKSVSCASCHRPESGFASPEPLAIGISGSLGTRNTPTIFNRGFGGPSFWDGRVATLEEQVIEPISNPVEFGNTMEQALKDLKAKSDYAKKFKEIYQEDNAVNEKNLANALAGFVRSLVIADSPVDAFHHGNSKALNAVEKRGLWIFESKGGCWQCHTGFNFSDEQFHNTGVSWLQEKKDEGRGGVTKDKKDMRAFKTPTLRGLVSTAPYMHDGSLMTLKEVVEFYDQGGSKDGLLDPKIRPLNLDDSDKKALVAFLEALSRNAVDTTKEAGQTPKKGEAKQK